MILGVNKVNRPQRMVDVCCISSATLGFAALVYHHGCLSGGCQRCFVSCLLQVTTTDQVTAKVSEEREPLKTLGTFRSGKTLGWKQNAYFANSVFFGWNLVSEATGTISVSDQLLVSQWRKGYAAAPVICL